MTLTKPYLTAQVKLGGFLLANLARHAAFNIVIGRENDYIEVTFGYIEPSSKFCIKYKADDR